MNRLSSNEHLGSSNTAGLSSKLTAPAIPDLKSQELFPLDYKVSSSGANDTENVKLACEYLGLKPASDPISQLGLVIGAPHNSTISIRAFEDPEGSTTKRYVSFHCHWGKVAGRMVFTEGYGGDIHQLMLCGTVVKNVSNPIDTRLHFERIEMRGIDSQGMGSRIVAMMVRSARALGINRIEASGVSEESYRNHVTNQVGYYFVPRLGFDNPLKRALCRYERDGTKWVDRGFRDAIRDAWPGTQRISDLMNSEEKRQWWRKNGATVHLTFDTRANSPNSKLHESYLREKHIFLPDLTVSRV